MQRRTILFLSLAAALVMVAAVAWWLPASLPDNGSGPDRPQPPSDEAPGPRTGQQQPMPPPKPGAPRVDVAVTAAEKLVPPPPVRVQAVRAGDGAELPTVLLAGAGAGFDTSPHVAGVALCEVGADGERVLRQIALTAGAIARPVVGTRLVVQGHVRDADGNALAGASVWFGELDAAGTRRDWTTDDDGAFTAEVPAGTGVPFVVRKVGFAAWWRPVDVTAPPRPCDAVLSPGCTLEVGVAGGAAGIDEARVFVVPGERVATAIAQWPFLLQVLQDGVPFDASGRAVIDELPRTGEIGLVVRHPRALRQAPFPVVLKGDRVRTTVPMQIVANAWRGSVVDEAGQPLAGIDVWARPSRRDLEPGSSQRLLPPHLDERGVATTRTAADGTFTIAAIDAPDAVLSLRGSGFAGRDVAASSLSADRPLVLPAWRGGEPELRLQPPLAGVAWEARADLGGGVSDALAADTPWRVSLPHAGFFHFVLTTTIDGTVRGTQRLEHVAVTGALELASPKPN